MRRRAKRGRRGARKRERKSLFRAWGSSQFLARLLRVPLIVLSLSGLLAAGVLVALFILSSVFAWLLDTEEKVAEPPRDISIEVLNGCGAGGAAKELTSILRTKGFDVTDFRNAEDFGYSRTVVRIRNVDREKGEAFAAFIGTDSVVAEGGDRSKPDICVVVGEDWKELPIVAGRGKEEGSLTRMIDFFRKMNYNK